jgi:hypothetical protein
MTLQDDFESGDLLPNPAPLNLDPPEEQVLEEQTERGEMVTSAPIIDSLISWFDEQIDQARDIRKLDLESNVPLPAQILAAQEFVRVMTGKRYELLAKQDSFIKNYRL